MIIFWSVAVVMIISALAIIVQPLRGSQSATDNSKSDPGKENTDISGDAGLTQQQQNIRIAKERLEELKLELAQGVIDQSSYEQSRTELELTLLDDIETDGTGDATPALPPKTFASVYTLRALLVIVPLFSIGLYFVLGSPAFVSGEQKQTASSMPADHGHGGANGKLPSIEVMVENLAKRLQREPDDAGGWFMLGRSYMSLGQYGKAVTALEQANKLMPSNPNVMLRYADALTMTQGGRIQGKPFELIQQALKLSPENTTGLWLAGMGYEERGEYATAISHWNRLLPQLQDEKSIAEVKALIRQTKHKAGMSVDSTEDSVFAEKTTQPASMAGVSLKVDVSLDASLLGKANKDDTVFIFARAVNGPPMPLAVVRKKVKDLPVQVVLNDSMAMIPSMKLSAFKKVQLVARISKSGQPLAQPGDLSSKAQVIELPFQQTIRLSINSITK